MVTKYSANLLESAAKWLGSRSNTVWAKACGHQSLMTHYSEGLLEIAESLRALYPSCPRCKGLLNKPLARPQHSMDCECVVKENQNV